MNSKLIINQRFIDSVNYLISEKKGNKSTISEKINISKSKFSEILNNRMSIGIEDLANFIEAFSINPYWILTGKGKMLLNYDSENNSNFSEPITKYEVESNDKTILQLLQNQIAELKEDKDELKKDKQLLQEIIQNKLGNQKPS